MSIDVRAHVAAVLNEMNCNGPLEERTAIIAQFLAVVDGQVRVTDEHGAVRMRGNSPMTVAELIDEMIFFQVPSINWRPTPSNFSRRRSALPSNLAPRDV